MLKNITLSADETLIREARSRAAAQNTTLNALFREWLEDLVKGDASNAPDVVAEYHALMERLRYVRSDRKFSRDEMNER